MSEFAPKKEKIKFDPKVVQNILDATQELRNSPDANLLEISKIRSLFEENSEESKFIDLILSLKPEDLGVNLKLWGGKGRKTDNLTRISGQEYMPKGNGAEKQLNEETVSTETKTIRDQFLPGMVFIAYNKMQEAMEKEISKKVLVQSGYRSYAYQLLVFLGYLKNKNFDIYETAKLVALPGYSEHEDIFAPAIDFLDPDDRKFEDTEQFLWVQKNASRFGFNLSFPKKSETGIQYEPWHWKFAFPNSFELKPFQDSKITASIFGRNGFLPESKGWSLKTFVKTEQVDLPEYAYLSAFLREYAESTGVKTFKAPAAEPQNGKIADEKYDFNHNIDLGNDINLLRSDEGAEGCEIFSGEAFVVTPADCLTVAIRSKKSKRMFAAHAGRESLFQVGRENGVIENLLSQFTNAGESLEDLEIFGGFGVSAGEYFSHNELDDRNKIRHEELKKKFPETCDTEIYKDGKHLSLNGLFVNLCRNTGITDEQIALDETDTFLSEDENGNYKYNSKRRDKEKPEGEARNMVVVTNLV